MAVLDCPCLFPMDGDSGKRNVITEDGFTSVNCQNFTKNFKWKTSYSLSFIFSFFYTFIFHEAMSIICAVTAPPIFIYTNILKLSNPTLPTHTIKDSRLFKAKAIIDQARGLTSVFVSSSGWTSSAGCP